MAYWSEREHIDAKLLKYSSDRCAYCGKLISLADMEKDHVVPKVKGGISNNHNYLPSCRPCNLHKHDNPPDNPVQLALNLPRVFCPPRITSRVSKLISKATKQENAKS